MHAYFIKANEVKYDENGEVCEVLCTYDEKTLSGSGFNERKPNGNIGYVDASTAMPAKFNLFEPLILDSEDESLSFMDRINPDSWKVLNGFVEKGEYKVQDKFQFIRDGYYCVDNDTTEDNKNLVFNRIVSLKSSKK